MTDVERLIVAYGRWDAKAAAMPRRPSLDYLKAEAAALGDAIALNASSLGISSTSLMKRVVDMRRAGSTVEDAVRGALT